MGCREAPDLALCPASVFPVLLSKAPTTFWNILHILEHSGTSCPNFQLFSANQVLALTLPALLMGMAGTQALVSRESKERQETRWLIFAFKLQYAGLWREVFFLFPFFVSTRNHLVYYRKAKVEQHSAGSQGGGWAGTCPGLGGGVLGGHIHPPQGRGGPACSYFQQGPPYPKGIAATWRT